MTQPPLRPTLFQGLHLRTSESPFLTAFTLALAFLAVCLHFLQPRFLVNDDWFSMFVSQGSGFALRPDEHLFFNNVLLGFLLKGLNLAFPDQPWYTFLLIAALWLPLGCMGSLFLLRRNSPSRIVLFLLVLAHLGAFFYLKLNYSLISALNFQAGLLLYFHLFSDPAGPQDRKIVWLGGLCFFLSLLLRWKGFLAWTLLLFPIVALGAWMAWKQRKHRRLLAALLMVLGLAFLLDYLYFWKDPDWRKFQTFTYSTAPAIDWSAPDINPTSEPIFREAGFTQNDLEMFKNWYYMDPDLYLPENFSKIKDLFRHDPVDPLGTWKEVAGDPLCRNAAACFLVFLLLCPAGRVRLLLFQALWTGAGLVLFLYLARLPDRVLQPSFFFLALLGGYFAAFPFPAPAPKRGAKGPGLSLKAGRWALLLLALLCIPSLGEFRSISSIQRAQKDYLYDQLERLDPKADQLFVIWDSAFPFEYLDPFDGLSELPERFNLFSLATFQRAPLSREILERFKIKDLLEGIVDNPSAFMICTGHHGYLYWNYMKEKHGVKIRAEKVFECQYFKVFKIRSKPPNDRGPDLGRKGLVEGGKESF